MPQHCSKPLRGMCEGKTPSPTCLPLQWLSPRKPQAFRLRLSVLSFVAGSVASCGGCATGYLSSRGRDGLDVVTLTLGHGAGAKARVGPLQVAVVQNHDLAGLRAGEWFAKGFRLEQNDERYVLPFPLENVAWKGRGLPYGLERFSHGPDSLSHERGKDILARSPFPGLALGNSWAYFGQMEVAVGLGLTLRLGLNLIEFLDLVLGWGGIDLLGDDRPLRMPPPTEGAFPRLPRAVRSVRIRPPAQKGSAIPRGPAPPSRLRSSRTVPDEVRIHEL